MAKETPKAPETAEAPSLVGLDDDEAVAALAGLGDEALNIPAEEGEEAKPPAKSKPETEEEEGEEAEESEESEEESEEEAEGEEEEEEAPLSSFADLAKDYGVKEEEFLSSVGIEAPDGQTVTLGDVVTAWREGGDVSGARAAFETEQTAFKEREQKFRAKEAEGLQGLYATTERLITMIEGEEKIDWKALEKEDPVEYVHQRQKATDRREALGESIARMRQADTERAERERGEFVAFQQAEARKAIEVFPAWKDRAVAEKAMNQAQGWLRKVGFSDEEMDALADHRVIIGVWKASEFDRLMAAKPGKLKRAKDAPKLVPLHARKGKGQETRTRQRLRRTLEQTGDDRVAAKLLEAHV